jgi:putative ABC transport system permease protein
MALGALFGSVKILHATVDSRARKIAVLRAIGYGGAPVAAALVLEAAVLSLLGAMAGDWSAWLLCDSRVEAINNAIFTLSVSARLVALGMGWALLAILGGLAPAIRGARLAVAAALQQRDAAALWTPGPPAAGPAATPGQSGRFIGCCSTGRARSGLPGTPSG